MYFLDFFDDQEQLFFFLFPISLDGACYNWLYSKMKNHHVKFFHIIVTWFEEPHKKIDFRNPKDHSEIGDHMAPMDGTHLGSPLTESTLPFVTFIKLIKPGDISQTS